MLAATTMEVSAIPDLKSVPKRRNRRLLFLLTLGIVAIVGGLLFRNSAWAREKRLENLNIEELALEIHDSPNDPLTFLYFGSALLKANSLENSEKAFQRALTLDKRSVRALVGLGNAQLRAGKLEQAHTSFEQAVKLDSKNVPALLGLAQTYYESGTPRNAIEPLKKVVELDPKNAGVWYYLGRTYGDARVSDQALEAMKRATELDPKQADFWRDLGQLYSHYSKNKEAEEAFTMAVTLRPEDPAGHLLLGNFYAEKRSTPQYRTQAEEHLLSAIKLDPNMAAGHYQLGQLYERDGNFKAAVPYYRKAVALDASDDKALYSLGHCLVQIGQKAEGEKLLKGAQALRTAKNDMSTLENRIRSDPKNRSLNLRLARVYRRYGNFEGALSQYKRYQQLGPNDPAIDKEAVAYIKELQKQGMLPASP
jgi:cytochrome c-type biogenesis protein CcmH/NrfG